MDEHEPIAADVAAVPVVFRDAVGVPKGKPRGGLVPTESRSSVLVHRLNKSSMVEATADLVMLEKVDEDFDEAEPDMAQLPPQQAATAPSEQPPQQPPRGLLLQSTPSQIPDKVANAQRQKHESKMPMLNRDGRTPSVDAASSGSDENKKQGSPSSGSAEKKKQGSPSDDKKRAQSQDPSPTTNKNDAPAANGKEARDVDVAAVKAGATSSSSVLGAPQLSTTAKAGQVLAEQKQKRSSFKPTTSVSSQATSESKQSGAAVPPRAPALQPPQSTGAVRHGNVDFGEEEPASSVSRTFPCTYVTHTTCSRAYSIDDMHASPYARRHAHCITLKTNA
jgi:hypothetical protein